MQGTGSDEWLTLRVPNEATSITIYDLKAGNTYQFCILSRNRLGDGLFSNIITATTQGETLYSSALISNLLLTNWQISRPLAEKFGVRRKVLFCYIYRPGSSWQSLAGFGEAKGFQTNISFAHSFRLLFLLSQEIRQQNAHQPVLSNN